MYPILVIVAGIVSLKAIFIREEQCNSASIIALQVIIGYDVVMSVPKVDCIIVFRCGIVGYGISTGHIRIKSIIVVDG